MAPTTRSSLQAVASAVPLKRKQSEDDDDNNNKNVVDDDDGDRKGDDSQPVKMSSDTATTITTAVTPTVSSSSKDMASLKMTIVPSTTLHDLRGILAVTESNNADLTQENAQLQHDLAEERRAVALLHTTSMEWVRLEREKEAELQLTKNHVQFLAKKLDENDRGAAPLINRIRQLEVLNDALNARIRGLEFELAEVKEKGRESDYPPL